MGATVTQKKWTMRPYRPGDEEQIRGLFKQVFGKELGAEQWAWMYRDNHTDKITITLAEAEDGELAGQYAVRPVRMKISDQARLGTLSLDTMVHPDYRGQGMFTKLASRMYEDVAAAMIPLTYGFPNKNSYHGFVAKLDWLDLGGQVPVFIRPLNPRVILEQKLGNPVLASITGGLAKAGLGVLDLLRRPSLPPDCRLERVDRFDERVDQVWERASQACQILVVRDQTYLNWRYVENPEGRYDLFVVERGKRPAGYMVLKQEPKFGFHMGYIADVLTVPEDAVALGQGLVARALNHFRERDVDLASCLMMEHTPYREALRKNGFFRVPEKLFPQELYLGVRRNTDEYPGEFLSDPRNWFITWGDHDAV